MLCVGGLIDVCASAHELHLVNVSFSIQSLFNLQNACRIQVAANCGILRNITFDYRGNKMSEEIIVCPCGSGKKYADCCKPIIDGTQKAATAETLMRARYSAYVAQKIDFIVDSCEEGEGIAEIDKKATEEWSKNSKWHGLTILNTEKGTENDDEGTVEFTADYTLKQMRDSHHEIAAFKKVNGEWKYVAGNIVTTTVKREGRKIGRNEPCPCGSGKKYKNCCGKN